MIKENKNWVLENLIVELSKKWEAKTIGVIKYYYPSSHDFDMKEAKLSIPFCKDIISRFNPDYDGSFK